VRGAFVKVAVEELEAASAPGRSRHRRRVQKNGRRVRSVQKQARLPLPQGPVPRSLVKLHFADDVRREVAEHLIPTCTAGPHEARSIRQRARPQEVKLEEKRALSFVAVVEVKPAIALADYRAWRCSTRPPR